MDSNTIPSMWTQLSLFKDLMALNNGRRVQLCTLHVPTIPYSNLKRSLLGELSKVTMLDGEWLNEAAADDSTNQLYLLDEVPSASKTFSNYSARIIDRIIST